MDNKIPAVVKTEQPEVYLDYAEIPHNPQSYPFITTQEHSQADMFPITDFKFVKHELSKVLCKDKTHRLSKSVDMAKSSFFKEMTGESNTDPTNHERDYKVLFKLENYSSVAENVSSLTEVTKNPYLTKYFSFQHTGTVVTDTQISKGSLDFTDDSASSNHPTPYMLDGCDPCAEKETQKVNSPQKQQVSGAAVTEGDHLKHHLRTQNEELFHNCDGCITSFAEECNVQCYKRTNTSLGHEGDVCGASFSHACNLKCHNRIHTVEKPYKCDDCGASFSHASSLKNHKRTHTGEKPYKCDDCGASFSHASSLKNHKRTHTGEKPYKCDLCSASFIRYNNLKTHKRTHTGEKPYKCDVCGECFSQNGNLSTHKRTHTGEKPYKCDVCGACFSQTGSLSAHKRIHTGEKPNKCDLCSASFNRYINLKNHKRTHTEEKPFK